MGLWEFQFRGPQNTSTPGFSPDLKAMNEWVTRKQELIGKCLDSMCGSVEGGVWRPVWPMPRSWAQEWQRKAVLSLHACPLQQPEHVPLPPGYGSEL